MSVRACARRGCENVMCDRLSDEYGYICNDCFEDLIQTGQFTSIPEFLTRTRPPMSTRKEAEARYNAAFPMRHY